LNIVSAITNVTAVTFVTDLTALTVVRIVPILTAVRIVTAVAGTVFSAPELTFLLYSIKQTLFSKLN
jgi:hypothetical protein